MRPYAPRHFVAISLLVGLVAALPFLLGLGGPFVFDDRQTVALNEALHVSWSEPVSFLYAAYSYSAGHGSRALTMLTFALDYRRGGADPAIFKSTNIAIHAATVVALAGFYRALLLGAGWPLRRAAAVALAMAAIWALHPIQVSAVLYAVQRMQTLATLFTVLALWAYVRMRQAQADGSRSRQFAVLGLLAWALAFASKEDSILLPAYTMLLEVTVLRFKAADALLARRLRIGYGAMFTAGLFAYLLVVLPHFWSGDAYPGRNFSSSERLLSQARVLSMYLGQILWPIPSHLPFYYDNLTPSRGLLDPPTTLASLGLVTGLIALAWALRSRRPLFAFGVLLYFAGHFVTSNVLNLELAFEHRNHLPLVGAVLALGDLVDAARRRWSLASAVLAVALPGVLALLTIGTSLRAYQWGDPTRFAEMEARIAPGSARAWLNLCTHYYDLRNTTRDGHYLDKAITACEAGAKRTGSPSLLFNVIVYKTLDGRAFGDDWTAFIESLRRAPLSAEVQGIYAGLLRNLRSGLPLDPDGAQQALDVLVARSQLQPQDYIAIATYVYNNGNRPDEALRYLERAVGASPPDSAVVEGLYRNLAAAGRSDWVERLRTIPRHDVPSN